MVQSFGHDTSIARHGAEALSQARAFLPQVVLLDIGMPGINGYEVCQSMKRIPELQRTVFIAQTGWSGKQHRDFSKEAGFDLHLVKPIDSDHLERILAAIE